MAAKKTADEYKDLYFEEKFNNIDEKLDTMLNLLGTKASSSFVNSLEGRMRIIENNHTACPLHSIVIDIKQLKDDRDTLMDITEEIRFYKKKPNQFKILIIGFVVLIFVNILAFLPTIFDFAKNIKGKPVTEVNVKQ